MAETATYISELDPTTVSPSTDPIDGGAQLRVIKDTIDNTIGGLDGDCTGVTAAKLNVLDYATLGTAAASKAIIADASANIDASAITWTDLGTVTTVDINGGTIDGVTVNTSAGAQTGGTIDATVIGGSTPAAGTFTTLTATGAVNLDSGAIDGVTIGGATPAAGSFTTLSTSGLATLASTTLAAGATITEYSIDDTMAGDSDTAVPTEQAVKGYVDTQVATKTDTTYVDARARYVVTGVITDVSTAETIWVVCPVAGDVVRFDTVLEGIITVGNAAVTLKRADDTNVANVTVAFSGSAAGDVDSDASPTNVAVTAGQPLKIATDGGSTGAQRVWFSITVDNS